MVLNIPKNGIAISSMGMVTSLGFDAENCCAAARAGILRLNELQGINATSDDTFGGEPIMGHRVSTLVDGYVGFGKTLMLGYYALLDLLSRRHFSNHELQHTGLFINLSDNFLLDYFSVAENEENSGNAVIGAADLEEENALPSVLWKEKCRNLISRLLEISCLNIPQSQGRIYFNSQTGIAEAIQEATKSINAGELDRCIIGGIDSCIEPRFLTAAAAMGILKTSINPGGLIPGEAAGFILLERSEDVLSKEIDIKCHLGSSEIVHDKFHRFADEPPNGSALFQAIDTVLSSFANPAEEIGVIIGDLNGDNFRAMEWGCALVRLHNKYKIGNLPIWLPAMAFGETGAATELVSICMGILGFNRGYAPDGAILVWSASDKGTRSALCIDRKAI